PGRPSDRDADEARMKVLLAALSWLLVSAPANAEGEPARGALVLVGGSTTQAIAARTLALAGGGGAVVAVLPQASTRSDAGEEAVRMFRRAGARRVGKVSFRDPAAAKRALERSDLIWISGGMQQRFMEAIQGTGLAEIIRARHADGAVVAGSSAGAAVMSAIMIFGGDNLETLTVGETDSAPGLGLWPDVIVDQHFLERQRHNRLLAAVLDHPGRVGVGIDAETAVIVRGSRMEVIGRSAVVVVDARRAQVLAADHGDVTAATGLTTHVLRAGMTLDLAG
ncbi:MAG: cyanophycinase, partial [Caulobacterales bacterium]|nr:cyanophycinase [Caulobacterales bacterium]